MKTVSRAAGAGALACAAVLLTAPAASAHVHASAPDGAQQGEYAVVTLRVPNEQDTAKTTKIVVTLPTDHPVGSVSTKPVPGWQVQVAKTKLNPPKREGKVTITEAPTTVTYTADPGGGILPDQFQTFDLSLGPLPTDTSTLLLPTVQTYDNGVVANWTAPTKPGQPEPEHPAPQVTLTAAGSSSGAVTTPAATDSAGADSTDSTDQTARWLGGAGLVVGVLGLAFGGVALARLRRSR